MQHSISTTVTASFRTACDGSNDMKILAIDLGKFNSVWCEYRARGAEHTFGSVKMSRRNIHDLLVEKEPDRLVIEVGNNAGWVHDLALALGVSEIQVANPNGEAWRWRRVKRKTDRDDALKLARMSAMNQIDTVHMPAKEVRDWRSLIQYRKALVNRRTMIKNSIRAILQREEITLPAGKNGWTNKALAHLHEIASVPDGTFWRMELASELLLLGPLAQQIKSIEKNLKKIANRDDRVALLKTAPAVGDRLAEAMVAIIDDPHRFTRGRDVGCYIGMTPRPFESGARKRQGGISGQGNKLLRSLLVEIAWLGVSRHKVGWMVEYFQNVCRGSKQRRKIAIVAVARRLLIKLWAMLRDHNPWRFPTEQAASTPLLKLADVA